MYGGFGGVGAELVAVAAGGVAIGGEAESPFFFREREAPGLFPPKPDIWALALISLFLGL